LNSDEEKERETKKEEEAAKVPEIVY